MTGDRVLALFSSLALQVAGLGVLVFWVMGALFLLTGNGGQIVDIYLTGFWRNLYFLYPVALVVFSLAGWFLFYLKRDLLAILTFSAPVGLVVLYYLILIFPSGARA